MKTTVHKSDSRGIANHGWLHSNHSFSFANYYNPERVRFGNLRVLNDDIVAPGSGFDKHPHDNMEIVSIPLKGSLMHIDSMGNRQILGENEVQVMSAGTGIFHSEYNASKTEEVNFLQLWILPELKNIKPSYKQQLFDPRDAANKWQTLIDQNSGPLKLNQNVTISRVFLNEGGAIKYHTKNNLRKTYLFIVTGRVELNEIILSERDAVGIEDTSDFELNALRDSYIINIEI